MRVAKHAESDGCLISVKHCPESLCVFMTALVGDVTQKNCKPSLSFKFFEVFLDELQVLIWILELVPEQLVVPVATLRVQGKDAGV